MSLFITLILGGFFVIGMLVVQFSRKREEIEHYSIAVALGAMLGIAVLDIIPEVIEATLPTHFYLPIIGGVIGFVALVVLDKFIPEHEEEDESYTEENMVHIGMISSIAIIIHNIIEGMAVYSLANQSVQDGLLLMLGVGLHNIPMGMFIYSMLKSKKGMKKNIFMFFSVVSTFIGGLIMFSLSAYMTEAFDVLLYGIALGMIVYIVMLELLPYVKRNKQKLISCICSIAGFAIVLVSVFLE